MKGDESRAGRKGQERGAQRGPGGESIGGHLGLTLPQSLACRSPFSKPSVLLSLCLPVVLLLGHCFGHGLRRIRRTETRSAGASQPLLSPQTQPLHNCAFLRGRSWLRRNITRRCSRAGRPGTDRSFSPLPAFVGTAVFFVSASHPHFLRLGQQQIAPSSPCPSLPASSFDQESPC